MDIKSRDYIFFWICFLTPWASMNPWMFQWWGKIYGPLNGTLVVYPLTIGIIYSLYLQYKGKNVFVYNKWIAAFFVGSMLVELITIAHGAYIFPYWEMIDLASIPTRIQNTYIGSLFRGSGGIFSSWLLNRIYLFSYLTKEAFICAIIL